MSSREALIFNLAVAVRRLLIKADKKSSAARFATAVLAEADSALVRR